MVDVTDELLKLREECNTLGIKYSPNAGVDTLKKKLESFEAPLGTEEVEETPVVEPEEVKPLTKVEQWREAMKLIRLEIHQLDPNDKSEGAIWSVANDLVGKVAKYIPYKKGNMSYHVPNILYKQLRDAKYWSHTPDEKNPNHIITELVPKFNLIVLPQLTEAELKELAKEQKAGNRI